MFKQLSKKFVLLLCLALAFFVVGCKKNNNNNNNDNNNNNNNNNNQTIIPEVIDVSNILLSKTDINLYIGESVSIEETIIPSNATSKTVVWSSSNPTVADYINGKIIAMSEGMTIIKATANNGVYASCVVTVSKKEVLANSAKFEAESYTMFVGQERLLGITFSPERIDDTSGSVVSSNTNVVTVKYDAGVHTNGKQYIHIVATAKSVGTSIITVKLKGGTSCSVKVTVNENMENKVKLYLNRELPIIADYIILGNVNERAYIYDVKYSIKQINETTVQVQVYIYANKVYGGMGDECYFVVELYRENGELCEKKQVHSNTQPFVGDNFVITYTFNVDITSGTERKFYIDFSNYVH